MPDEGKPVPIACYFGGALREFIGYWTLDINHQYPIEERAANNAVVWRTTSGNRLMWVEAWYCVPAYISQPALTTNAP